MTFAEQLKKLPKISHLASLVLLNTQAQMIAEIANKPGQAGSVAVYNYLGQIYGAITLEAAKKGLELYAEHTEDARLNPGKHPNIDRLLAITAGTLGTLRIKHAFATHPE